MFVLMNIFLSKPEIPDIGYHLRRAKVNIAEIPVNIWKPIYWFKKSIYSRSSYSYFLPSLETPIEQHLSRPAKYYAAAASFQG